MSVVNTFLEEILDCSPVEYSKKLKKVNGLVVKTVKSLIEFKKREISEILKINNKPIEYGIFITGSSGRFESSKSKEDFRVIINTGLDNKEKERMKQDLDEIIKNSVIEIKEFQTTLSIYEDNPNRVFPTLVLDLYPIQESEKIKLLNVMEKFVEELENNGGVRIYNKTKKRFSEYKRLTKKGTQKWRNKVITHFNLSTGEFYYNPKKGVFGSKYGPLRTIQFYLAKEIIKHIRNSNRKDYFVGMLVNIPRQITERINYLIGEKILNLTVEQGDRLAENYSFFLKLYHELQIEYSRKGEEVVLHRDNKEVMERIESLLCIIKS